MTKSINLNLTDALRRHVDARAGGDDVYATPSEYIRDLIRRDMEDWAIVCDVAEGLQEARAGDYASESVLDILHES